MTSPAITVVFSFLLMILLVWAFFVLYVKSILEEAMAHGQVISEKIRLRLDIIPCMIETVRRYAFSDATLVTHIIRLRANSWPIDELSVNKVQNELSMSAALHTLCEQAARNQDIQKDIHFLGLRAEIYDIGKNIEKLQDTYNQKIRLYNKKVNFFLLKPFLSPLGLHSMPIFEFEA